jgi:Ca2+-binding RTX toxin-like protein
MTLNGIFQDVTSEAGFTYLGRTHGAAWGDFNGDLYPDIFVGNHDSAVGNDDPNAVNLYLNQQDGTFVDVASTSIDVFDELVGINSHDYHSQAFVDFDNDGDQDLFLPEHSKKLPDRLLVNDGGFLSDQASELGFSYPNVSSHNSLFFDYNQDSLIDVFVATVSSEIPSTVFRQNSNGTYQEVGSTVLPGNINSTYAILGDLSNDGNLDLIIPRANVVLDVTSEPFTDITNTVVPSSNIRGIDAVTGDFNGDLLTDLYITRDGFNFDDVNQVSPTEVDLNFAKPSNTEKGISFETTGNVTISLLEPGFVDTLDETFIGSSGINPTEIQFTLDPNDPDVQGIASYTPGVDSGIFIGFEPNSQQWQIRASNETISELPIKIESTEAISNITAIGFDPNRPPATDKLFFNTGNGLEDVSKQSGIRDIPVYGRNVVTGDFDNDMDLDFYFVNTKGITNLPNVLIENQGDGTFTAVNNGGGAPGPNDSVGLGDAVAVADYDLDGFLDLFITNGFRPREFHIDGPHQLYRNQGNSNRWLEIDLQGVQSNRDGIGAKVFVTAGGVTQVREQTGGIHYKTQNHQRLHFGLAENTTVERITVQWPSGIIQQIDNVSANQLIEIIEADNGVINNPPVALDDTATTEANVAVNLDVLANDSDADGDALRLSIDTAPSNGTAVVNDNGTPNNFLDDSIIYTPDSDFTGTDEFLYQTDDLLGGTDTATVSVTVNPSVPNSINGSEGRDTLEGTNEAEIINGLGDRDVLRGNVGNDTLNGNEGNDNLNGGFGDDVLNGDSGNDILIGSFGDDTLTGGADSDRFRFTKTTDRTDEITDFTPNEDTLQFKANNFGGLATGTITAEQFELGTTAVDSDDRFIYDRDTGNLFFDDDGNGENAQVLITVISNQANLSASDLVIF